MAPIQIAPALKPDEWKARDCGYAKIDCVWEETHVVVRDPDGEVVSVSGPDEIFALIALANDALPDDDPRKITREKVRLLIAMTDKPWDASGTLEQHTAVRKLVRALEALLPPAS
jgi:hypothetical protein